jgi:hypothetical protein
MSQLRVTLVSAEGITAAIVSDTTVTTAAGSTNMSSSSTAVSIANTRSLWSVLNTYLLRGKPRSVLCSFAHIHPLYICTLPARYAEVYSTLTYTISARACEA